MKRNKLQAFQQSKLVPDRTGWLSNPLYPHAHLLEEKLTYSIYQCMTPFVKGDDDDVDSGNLGIDGSDVNQGRLPDCFGMATLGAIAESCPSVIKNGIHETPGGWIVDLYFRKPGENSRHLHSILIQYSDLSDGPNMAAPTGDMNPDSGCAEIWPMLYELAINTAADQMDMTSGDPAPYGTSGTEGVFLMVTDQEAWQTIDLNGKSDQWIYDEINRNASSRKMVLGTKATIEEWVNVDLSEMDPPRAISPNHSYYVESIGGDVVTLDNPWGERADLDKDVSLPKMYLNNVFSTLVILPDCD